MATQREKTVVYAAGVAPGIALVTFPAASTILTDPSEYDLSSTQYGTLFLPQVVTAIVAAVPERKGDAEALLDVREAGEAVFAPAVRA